MRFLTSSMLNLSKQACFVPNLWKNNSFIMSSQIISITTSSPIMNGIGQNGFKNGVNKRESLQIGIIGAPSSKGQPREGTELAPKVMRESGLIKQLQILGHDVKDYGDVIFDYNKLDQLKNDSIGVLKNPYTVGDSSRKLSTQVAQVMADKRIPITLGGDHSIAIGSIIGRASVDPNMCVIWIDAHTDINTAVTSKSGNIHGMPVSFLIKEISHKYNYPNDQCPGFEGIKPCISSANMAYIGIRDVDEGEANILRELNIAHYTMRDIDRLGIYEVIKRVLHQINPNLKRSIHVSFDIDALDEYIAASTGTGVPGGLTMREALCIGEEIAKTHMLGSIDLVEVNPLIGSKLDVERTVNCALNIVLSFFGQTCMNVYARKPGTEHYAT